MYKVHELHKQKIDAYWKDLQATLERSLVINCSMRTLESREMGHYQEPTAVITGPNPQLDGQHCAEFYQTIHYAFTMVQSGREEIRAL